MLWPFENERGNPTARARRIAHSYRTALASVDPESCRRVDEMATRFGETWVDGRLILDDDELVSASIAASIACVSRQTIRRYEKLGRVPGYQVHGVTHYRVGDIRKLPAIPLGRPPRRPAPCESS